MNYNNKHKKEIENMSEKEVIRIIEENPRLYNKFKNNKDTENVHIAGVKNGISLYKVPYNSRSRKVCWEAVKSNPYNIRFVPRKDNVIEDGMFIEAFKKDPSSIDCCYYRSLKNAIRSCDYDMKILILSHYGMCLQYIKECERTTELCTVAVTNNGMALKFVDDKIQNQEMCLKAVLQNHKALKYVKNDFQFKKDLINKAIELDGTFIEVLRPKGYLSESEYIILCGEAVNQNGLAIKGILPEYQSPSLCINAIKQNSEALKYIQQTKNICKAAFEIDPSTINYMYEKFAQIILKEKV